MKALVLLLFMTMTANASPVYMTCKGEKFVVTSPARESAELSVSIDKDTLSISIEGENWFLYTSPPSRPKEPDEYHFSKFGSQRPDGKTAVRPFGQINRITGKISVHGEGGNVFEGICQSTKKDLF
jgi:hypothetical protein